MSRLLAKPCIQGPIFPILLALFLSCLAGPAFSMSESECAPGDARISPGKAMVGGEILVKFKPSAGKTRIMEIADAEGLEVIKIVTPPGLYLMRSRGQDTEKLLKDLKKYEEIEYAEPNYIYRPARK